MSQGGSDMQSLAARDRVSRLAEAIRQKSRGNNGAVIFPPGDHRSPKLGGFVWEPSTSYKMCGIKPSPKTDAQGHCEVRQEVGDLVCGTSQFCTLIGTPQVFSSLGRLMVVLAADEFVRQGRLPVLLSSQAIFKLLTEDNFPLVEAMFAGFDQALREVKIINIASQTAEMEHGITAFCDQGSNDQLMLAWGATCLGLSHYWTFVDGSMIEPGQPIVALIESGYRGTGVAFLINLIKEVFGPEASKIRGNPDATAFARQLCVSSPSYARTVSRLIGWTEAGHVSSGMAQLTGIAHLTGTGFEKLLAILPKGIGAELSEMPKPPEFLLQAQKLSQSTSAPLSDVQVHSIFHGGCGMLVICRRQDDAKKLIEEAAKDGLGAQLVGITVPSAQSTITINSQFLEGGMVCLNKA